MKRFVTTAGIAVDWMESEHEFTFIAANYRMNIIKQGFRFGYTLAGGKTEIPMHVQSGIRYGRGGAGTDPVRLGQADVCMLLRAGEEGAVFLVRNMYGDEAGIELAFHASYVQMKIIPRDEGQWRIEARTGGMSPVYGLGDYGSQVNTAASEEPPARGKLDIPARDSANLLGFRRNDLVNQGTNMRFISNFTIFPAHRFAQVLFEEGSKQVAFTGTENKLGAAGVRQVSGLYYFFGPPRDIYSVYKQVRERHGYVDKKPKYTMFRVGWEAYGALGWNTYQSAVVEAVGEYLEHGYELAWAVVGSGFWKGDRKGRYEGTTTSFNIWDSEPEEERLDGLPNPRFPDVEGMKRFFRERGILLVLGLRNHLKAPERDGGFHHPLYNGGYFEEGLAKGYFLCREAGQPVRITNAQFPAGTVYVLDSRNPQAVSWFTELAASWGVSGFKEDAMIYTKHYADGNWNKLNESLMDRGYLVIARNSAYSVPADAIRINDTYYGTGGAYHFDQDRVPINLLNIAASGASNVYPDITGGTPKEDPRTPGYQAYFVRNAVLNAVAPAMSMGRRPWEMNNPLYEGWVKKAADWHNRYAPYIYSAVLAGYYSGFPAALTPLPLAFPEDANTYELASRFRRQYQWMLGPSMLAAPLYGNDFTDADSRDVYLPAGDWIDLETGARFSGPVTLKDYPMPMGKIPIFIGGEGVVVFESPGEHDQYMVEVYPLASPGTVYHYYHVDGKACSRIRLDVENWHDRDIRIIRLDTHEQVPAALQPLTGSYRFSYTPGCDYVISP